jgi:hypothetical protein
MTKCCICEDESCICKALGHYGDYTSCQDAVWSNYQSSPLPSPACEDFQVSYGLKLGSISTGGEAGTPAYYTCYRPY